MEQPVKNFNIADFDQMPSTQKLMPETGNQIGQYISTYHQNYLNDAMFDRYKMIQRRFAMLGVIGGESTIKKSQNFDPSAQIANAAKARNVMGLEDEEDLIYVGTQIIESIVGKISKQKYMPNVAFIDAMAEDAKMDYEAKLFASLMLSQTGVEIAKIAEQIGITPEDIPMDMTDFEVRIENPPKLYKESQLEIGIQSILYQNKIEDISYEVLSDLAIDGIGILHINRSMNQRSISRVDPMNFGCSNFTDIGAKDMAFAYHIDLVDIPKLKYEAQGQIDPEKLKQLKPEKYAYNYGWLMYGSMLNSSLVSTNFDNKAIRINFQITTNSTYYLLVMEDGQIVYSEDPKSGGKPVTFREQYTGKYIPQIGATYDYVRNKRIAQPITPNPEEWYKIDVTKIFGDYVVQTVGLKSGRIVSLLDKIMPHLKAIKQSWQKYVEAVDTFIPFITEINYNAIADNVLIGNETLSRDALIDLFFSKKIVVKGKIETIMPGGRNQQADQAVQIIANQGQQMITMLRQELEGLVTFTKSMAGTPDIVMGGTPSPYMPKGVAMMQAEGADNSMYNIISANYRMHQTLMENLMFDMIVNGYKGVYRNKPVIINPDNFNAVIANLSVELSPTPEQWSILFNELEQAKANGTVDLSTIALIQSMANANGNLKQAQMMLATIEKRKRIEAQQQSIALQKANGEEQRATAEMTNAMKVELERVKGEQMRLTKLLEKLLEESKQPLTLQSGLDMVSKIDTPEEQQ